MNHDLIEGAIKIRSQMFKPAKARKFMQGISKKLSHVHRIKSNGNVKGKYLPLSNACPHCIGVKIMKTLPWLLNKLKNVFFWYKDQNIGRKNLSFKPETKNASQSWDSQVHDGVLLSTNSNIQKPWRSTLYVCPLFLTEVVMGS